jgi:hypothetical protein
MANKMYTYFMRFFANHRVFLFSVFLITLNSSTAYAEDCWNTGIYEKNILDKKEKNYITGDIKEIDAVFNYDVGEISGTVSWNRIPSSAQTTNLIIGFIDNGGDCVTVAEAFKMKGWKKSLPRDRDTAPFDYSPDMMGVLSISETTKNSISFDWSMASIDAQTGGKIGEHCIKVTTTVPGRFYQSNTTCYTSNNFTTCDGPGWYSGLREIDSVTLWATNRWDSLSYMCT